MGQFNTCSKGKFQATGYGWNKTLVMTSGKLDIGDWCFCHVKPYDKQNAYFKITINMFEVGVSQRFFTQPAELLHWRPFSDALDFTTTAVWRFHEIFYHLYKTVSGNTGNFEFLFIFQNGPTSCLKCSKSIEIYCIQALTSV